MKVIVVKLDKIDENFCKGWKIMKGIDVKGGGNKGNRCK